MEARERAQGEPSGGKERVPRTVSGAAAAARLAGVLFPLRPPGREELEPKPDTS